MSYRRSVITAELWRPEIAIRWKKLDFFAFFGTTILYRKIFKILFRKDSSAHRLTCCVQISSIWPTEIGKIVGLHIWQKFHQALQLSLCADRVHNLPGPARGATTFPKLGVQVLGIGYYTEQTSGYATWFKAGSAIRIAHYDAIDDVITRKLIYKR